MKWWLGALLMACAGDGSEAPVEAPPTDPAPPIEAATARTVGPPGAEGLPDGPGRNLVMAHCSACHSLTLVAAQGMSHSRWDKTITWMQETQNLWPIPEADREVLVGYLATHFGEADPSGRAPTPWAEPTYRPNPVW